VRFITAANQLFKLTNDEIVAVMLWKFSIKKVLVIKEKYHIKLEANECQEKYHEFDKHFVAIRNSDFK
jgi:hypothetical protein